MFSIFLNNVLVRKYSLGLFRETLKHFHSVNTVIHLVNRDMDMAILR